MIVKSLKKTIEPNINDESAQNSDINLSAMRNNRNIESPKNTENEIQEVEVLGAEAKEISFEIERPQLNSKSKSKEPNLIANNSKTSNNTDIDDESVCNSDMNLGAK